MAETQRLTLADTVAIDIHAHVEMSKAGGDSLPDELREAAVRHFRGESARPTADELAAYYRERKMMAVIFTVDSEAFTGQTRVPNEEIAEVARANSDVLIPFASIDPHKGKRGVDEARRLIADHGVRGFKFHPNVQGFFPNDRMAYPLYEVIEEAGLPALFHTGQSGVGTGPAGRRRHPPQVLEPDARRRRRGRLPDAQDRARAPVVPVAGRGARGRRAQAAGLHRPVRLVAEVLPAAAGPARQHAAARARAVRHRLPVDHPRPLAGRLREARHQAGGAAADPEGERHAPARAGRSERHERLRARSSSTARAASRPG